MNDVRFGALCWNQYTDWPSLRAAGVRADQLGYAGLWTWDHLYPIVGSDNGPMLEAWMVIAGWAGVKIVSIAPGNAERGLPSIQGIYVLLDAETLSPVALLDGSAITSPAASRRAARSFATSSHSADQGSVV